MPLDHRISELFLRMRTELLGSVRRIAPPEAVEDIVQETYVRLCRLDDTEKIRHPRSYLFTTVRNMALDYVKRADIRLHDQTDPDDLEELTADDSTYAAAVSAEEFNLFCDAVRLLPVQCRRAFVLRKVYNFSQKEIARELNISESTVEKHIALGVRRCHQHMQRAGYQQPGSSLQGKGQSGRGRTRELE